MHIESHTCTTYIPTQKELFRNKECLEIIRYAWIGESMFGNIMKLFWWIIKREEDFMTGMIDTWMDGRLNE